MDVGSPSSMCSTASMDRFKRPVSRRSSTRRHRQSDQESAKISERQTARRAALESTRAASCNANFDNLLHDCAGLATFSVRAASDPVASHQLGVFVRFRLSFDC